MNKDTFHVIQGILFVGYQIFLMPLNLYTVGIVSCKYLLSDELYCIYPHVRT